MFRIGCDISPVVVGRFLASRSRSDNDIAASEFVKSAIRAQVTHQHFESAGRGIDVDIPVSNAAMNFDVSINYFGIVGCAAIVQFEKSQDGFYGMPIFSECGFCPVYGMPHDIPMCVDPIRIPNHQYQSILAFDDLRNWV